MKYLKLYFTIAISIAAYFLIATWVDLQPDGQTYYPYPRLEYSLFTNLNALNE